MARKEWEKGGFRRDPNTIYGATDIANTIRSMGGGEKPVPLSEQDINAILTSLGRETVTRGELGQIVHNSPKVQDYLKNAAAEAKNKQNTADIAAQQNAAAESERTRQAGIVSGVEGAIPGQVETYAKQLTDPIKTLFYGPGGMQELVRNREQSSGRLYSGAAQTAEARELGQLGAQAGQQSAGYGAQQQERINAAKLNQPYEAGQENLRQQTGFRNLLMRQLEDTQQQGATANLEQNRQDAAALEEERRRDEARKNYWKDTFGKMLQSGAGAAVGGGASLVDSGFRQLLRNKKTQSMGTAPDFSVA